MSETRGQQEPSMEEILASIRRIISEDGQEPPSEAKADRAGKSEPQPTQPVKVEEKEEEEDRANWPPLRAVGGGDAEILVLTEMVADDGSVVSLAGQSPVRIDSPRTADMGRTADLPPSADLSESPQSAGLPEPPEEPDATAAEDASSGQDAGDGTDAPVRRMPPELDERAPTQPDIDEPVLGTPNLNAPDLGDPDPPLGAAGGSKPDEADPVAEEPAEWNTGRMDRDAASPDEARPVREEPDRLETVQETSAVEVEPPKEQPARPTGEPLRPQAEPAPQSDADDRMEFERMAADARKKLELVSQEAEAASTAAIAELARTVSRDKEVPVDGGRSVEDLVLEAMKPMLRQWLDANLPELVERIVRTEIQRMVRRAEDKA